MTYVVTLKVQTFLFVCLFVRSLIRFMIKNTHDACPRNRFRPDNFHGDSIYSILIRETVACVGKLTLSEHWSFGG